MRIKRIISFLAILAIMTSVAWGVNRGAGKWPGAPLSLLKDTEAHLWANSIFCVVYNDGNFGFDNAGKFGKTDGLYFPFSSPRDTKSVIYAAGIWIGAQVNDEVRLAIAEYSSEFVPGPMKDNTFQTDQESFRVYKIGSGSEIDVDAGNQVVNLDDTEDRAAWPVEDGAPVDSIGNPLLLGTQMCWSVYNDADPKGHANMTTKTLGLEVQQSTFGFAVKGPLDNIIFLKYVLINKGTNTLDSTYISLWADPDVGDGSDDLVGCDTSLSLGYCYNDGDDDIYGHVPPAVGFDFFQGPLIRSVGDTAYLPTGPVPDFKQLGMTSFNKYINGTDPQIATEAYNYMKGVDRDGSPVEDPVTHVVTSFQVPGDPVAGTGWIDVASADRRYMMTTGPFTMEPGDTQVIVAAVVAAQGTDPLNAITELKRIDAAAQITYDLNFDIPKAPPSPVTYARGYEDAIELVWLPNAEGPNNYLQDYRTKTGELFIFEGYNVYIGDSPTGPWTKLATYDIGPDEQKAMYEDTVGVYADCVWDSIGGVWDCTSAHVNRIWDWATLYEDKGGERVVTQPGTNSGTEYQMRFEYDPRDGSPLIPYRPYYFAVTSYAVNIQQVYPLDSVYFGINFMGMMAYDRESRVVGIPVEPLGSRATLVLNADHTQGVSDGECIVEFLDQSQITGHEYEVNMDENLHWSLSDETLGTTVLSDQSNLSGDYTYPEVDGMMVRVQKPTKAIKAIDEILTGGEAVNVMGPENPDQTGTWCVKSDVAGNFERMNWRGFIVGEDWEFRFTENGSEYYDYNTDEKRADRIPFEIWNVGIRTVDDPSDDKRLFCLTLDDVADGVWSYGDRIYVAEQEYTEPLPDIAQYTWPDDVHLARVIFARVSEDDSTSDLPAPGTVVRFTTYKPLTPDDQFRFRATKITDGQSTVIAKTMDNIKTVPNPYYNYSSYELDQFNRVIKFINLPSGSDITIKIFNIAGDHIRTLTHPAYDLSSELEWDVKTENGLYVASGIYIYLAESELGQKVGKMAVFTEVEQLNNY